MSVSSEVCIMTRRELQDRLDASFQKGVVRGRFEESCDIARRALAMPPAVPVPTTTAISDGEHYIGLDR